MKKFEDFIPDQPIPPARICFPEDDIRGIQEDIGEILRTGQLTLGKHTRTFESEFAEYTGVKGALAVSSGTSALEIALRALDVKDRKVIVPVNTFFASASAVHHAGGRLVFADIDPDTLALDPDNVETLITEETAGVMVVHIGGAVGPKTKEIADLCKEKGVFLLEDAAHAHGSTLDGKHAGTFGDVGTFSFFPTKVMTSGEGGMIVKNRGDIIERGRILRDQGKASKGENLHIDMGYAWRMSELHAAVGVRQLRRLPEFVTHRQSLARQYDHWLQGIPGLQPMRIPETSSPNYYKYIAWLTEENNREVLKQTLRRDSQIFLSGEVYATPLHEQPIFQGLYEGGPFPNAERECAQQICLPISAVMTDQEVYYVAKNLKKLL